MITDKILNIKVKAEADISDLDDVQNQLEEVKQSAKDASDEISSSFQDVNDSANETGESITEVDATIKQIDDSNFKDLSSSVMETDEAVQELARDMEDVDKSMALNDAGMMLQTFEQIRGLSGEAENMSRGMNEASISVGQLATQTGIAEPQMVALINEISNATFPNTEAMLYVKSLSQMGVASENLGKSATDIDKINDAFGMGATATNGLANELSVLGLNMNNVSEGFNALAYANANTVGGMDNYYAFVKKFDSELHEFGLNVDQSSIIIAQATKKFGAGKGAYKGLSDALSEANGDVRKLEESLGLQAGTLDNASQITGQYEGQLDQLANEEAEHKTIVEQMGAVWEDLSLTFSGILSPMTSVIGLAGQIGSFAMGINGIVTLAETFGLLNAEMLATIPSQIAEGVAGWFSIGWILVAIAVILILVGVLWYLYNNNEQVREAINNFGQTLQWIASVAYSFFISSIQSIINILNTLWNIANTVIMGLMGAVQSGNGNILKSIANVIIYLSQLPTKLITIFANMIAKTLGFGNNFVQRMHQTAINSVNGFISNIHQLPSRLYTELSNTYSYVSRWASTLPQKFWNAGVDAVKNFLSALGIASPGTMQRMLIWEITEMGNRVPNESKNLLTNIGRLGSNIVDEFGNPTLELSANGTLLNNDNNNSEMMGNNYFTINIENVDSEDRVDEIVEAVRKSLAWSNTTAGRVI